MRRQPCWRETAARDARVRRVAARAVHRALRAHLRVGVRELRDDHCDVEANEADAQQRPERAADGQRRGLAVGVATVAVLVVVVPRLLRRHDELEQLRDLVRLEPELLVREVVLAQLEQRRAAEPRTSERVAGLARKPARREPFCEVAAADVPHLLRHYSAVCSVHCTDCTRSMNDERR